MGEFCTLWCLTRGPSRCAFGKYYNFRHTRKSGAYYLVLRMIRMCRVFLFSYGTLLYASSLQLDV
jgi:hypothetical protein